MVDVSGGLGSVDYIGTTSTIVNTLLWLLLLVLIGSVLAFLIYFFSFKHKVRVRKVMKNGHAQILEDVARKTKDEDGSVWWKLRKTRLKVKEPPFEALETNNRGKIFAEGYLLEEGRFVWRNNDFDVSTFKEMDAEYVKGGYDAFTGEERALLANEVEKSAQYKKRKISDLVAAAMPYLAVILILTIFMIFFDSAISPAIEMGSDYRAASADFKEAMQLLRDVVQQRETDWVGAGNRTIPN